VRWRQPGLETYKIGDSLDEAARRGAEAVVLVAVHELVEEHTVDLMAEGTVGRGGSGLGGWRGEFGGEVVEGEMDLFVEVVEGEAGGVLCWGGSVVVIEEREG
jgi:hypothetical protein